MLKPRGNRFVDLIVFGLHVTPTSALILQLELHQRFAFTLMKIKARSNNPLKKRARKGFRGFPVATVAFYGPDDRHANKLVIGIINHEGAEPELRKWYSEDADIRSLPNIEAEIQTFIKQHGVLSVSMVDRIIGCPHEEAIDYPDGASCPKCPFWHRRDRFTGEMTS
jgi:hypothetical protein